MREKWDEVHFSDGSTYGEKTVERAIAGSSEFYDPSTVVEEEPDNTSELSTDASRDNSDGAVRPTERLEALHDTIENLNTRIQTLEAENETLREEVEEERARREELETRLDAKDSDSNSLWMRFWSTITPE
jgi:predicted RNase H-like nuclease (RuvC/YqgF family)